MQSRKSLVLETFLRILIAVVALFVVIRIGRNIAEAVFGGDDELPSFNELAERINEMRDGSLESFDLILNKGNAVIGIGKDNEFRCVHCPIKDFSAVYQFFKSSSYGCEEGKSCLCLCEDIEEGAKKGNNAYELMCKKIKCKTMGFDFINRLNVVSAIWENGWFYVRVRDIDSTPFNGNGPATKRIFDKKQEVYIQKKDGVVGVCPTPSCIA